MLDFVFMAGAARDWDATCSVVVRPGDFPDDQTTSDHRPVSCVIDVPQSPGDAESIESAVRKVLDDQAAAWNDADIDRFMQHYWKSDQLTFSSEGKTLRGWDATMQRYRDRYPTPEKMGKLRFSELEVQPLGQTAALVLGRWHLIASWRGSRRQLLARVPADRRSVADRSRSHVAAAGRGVILFDEDSSPPDWRRQREFQKWWFDETSEQTHELMGHRLDVGAISRRHLAQPVEPGTGWVRTRIMLACDVELNIGVVPQGTALNCSISVNRFCRGHGNPL